MTQPTGRTGYLRMLAPLAGALALALVASGLEAQSPKQQQTASKTTAKPDAAKKPEPQVEQKAEQKADEDDEDGGEQKAPVDKKSAAQKEAAAVAARKAKATQAADAGAKALAAGKNEDAVRALSQALDTGALPPAEVARALYRRGIALRKLGRSSQSITDLNHALYLTGLSPPEKLDALHQRGLAYQAVGDSERAAQDLKAGKALDPSAVATAPAEAKTTPAPTAPKETKAAALAPKPPATPSEPPQAAQQTSTVTTFFNNLFSSTPSQTKEPVKSAPTQPTSWQTAVVVRPVREADTKAVPVAAQKPVTAPAAPVTTASLTERSPVKVQVASFQSEGQAKALIRQIKASHQDLLGTRTVATEKSVIGTMGTYYLVRIGPFASEEDGLAHCAKLRQAGLDCLIVK